MVPKLVQACSICNKTIHRVPKLVQACSICNKPIHRVPKLVQACSIRDEPIHAVLELVHACTNLKRDSYMSPLQFIILLVRGLANIP